MVASGDAVPAGPVCRSTERDLMPPTIRRAVIPAAGLGSRLLPLTKATPKEMLPVGDKPVIEHTVRELVASGITDITIVVRNCGQNLEIGQGYFSPHSLRHSTEWGVQCQAPTITCSPGEAVGPVTSATSCPCSRQWRGMIASWPNSGDAVTV